MTTIRDLYVIKIQHKRTDGEDYIVTRITSGDTDISHRTDSKTAVMEFIEAWVGYPYPILKKGAKA